MENPMENLEAGDIGLATAEPKPRPSSTIDSSGKDSYFWDEEIEDGPEDPFVPDQTTALLTYKVSRFFLQGFPDQRTLDVYKQKSISFHPWSDGKFYDWGPNNRFLNRGTLANADLELQANVQDWRRAVASLDRSNIPRLIRDAVGFIGSWAPDNDTRESVPLFKDNSNGDEYQLGLGMSRDAFGCHSLSVIYCERHLQGSENNVSHQGYFRLREGQNADLSAFSTRPIPAMVFPLGSLDVRRRSRTTESGFVTELTDYTVMVDVGGGNGSDLSLWIAATRSELVERDKQCRERWHNARRLPIFNGAMENDEGGYDIACIVPSIRHLAMALGEGSLDEKFRDACELVRRTRANIDPYLFVLTSKEADRIIHGNSS